ncbi:MAG: hypothetical protein VR72_00160 [Clostridiaceae bacterium BRH_c20a]|nr:MAG: hypothetical protein VR72_00160 [Clostridiaceae bacterium BRH_c20a]
MSTPIVSGIAALQAAKYKITFKEQISEDQLWKLIKYNTKDLGIPGADREYGTGFATLQPLELKLEAKNNDDYLKINNEIYNLDSKFSFNDGVFVLPGGLIGNVTGAYIQYNDKDILTFEY